MESQTLRYSAVVVLAASLIFSSCSGADKTVHTASDPTSTSAEEATANDAYNDSYAALDTNTAKVVSDDYYRLTVQGLNEHKNALHTIWDDISQARDSLDVESLDPTMNATLLIFITGTIPSLKHIHDLLAVRMYATDERTRTMVNSLLLRRIKEYAEQAEKDIDFCSKITSLIELPALATAANELRKELAKIHERLVAVEDYLTGPG